jgi:hypothetical protein
MLGFVREITNTLFLFAEDFPIIIVLSCYVFETNLYQLANLLCIESYGCYELVVWQYQGSIFHLIINSAMSLIHLL